MHIKESLINFLYDKSYFISVYDNYIHLFNYVDLIKIEEKEFIFKFDKFSLIISGNNLLIVKMNQNEVLIKGRINNIGLKYE